jgi:hypothetical protein
VTVFPPIELVIHTAFGGFHVNDEMALWLIDHRGWTLLPDTDESHTLLQKGLPPKHIVSGKGDYNHVSDGSSPAFRSDPDVVACVRALKKAHENDSYPEKFHGHIHGLAVVTVTASVEGHNQYDGIENVSVSWTVNGDKE